MTDHHKHIPTAAELRAKFIEAKLHASEVARGLHLTNADGSFQVSSIELRCQTWCDGYRAALAAIQPAADVDGFLQFLTTHRDSAMSMAEFQQQAKGMLVVLMLKSAPIQPAAPQEPDIGPWNYRTELEAENFSNRYFVESDGTPDVRLYINGNFEDDAARAAYGKWLAGKLNASSTVPDAAEAEKRATIQAMADCMDMVRGDLVEMGIIDKAIAPMFIPEAVAAYIKNLTGPDAAAVRDKLVHVEDGPPLPEWICRAIYVAWKARAGLDCDYDQFMAKYQGRFLSWDSIGELYRATKSNHFKVNCKELIDAALAATKEPQ